MSRTAAQAAGDAKGDAQQNATGAGSFQYRAEYDENKDQRYHDNDNKAEHAVETVPDGTHDLFRVIARVGKNPRQILAE